MKTAGPTCGQWKLLTPKHEKYVEPKSCQCETGRGPCPRPATDCIEDKSDITAGAPIRTMCRTCRVAVFGLSSAEKAARTKDFNRRQYDLFGGGK